MFDASTFATLDVFLGCFLATRDSHKKQYGNRNKQAQFWKLNDHF
jgi:hypothetical protein